MGGEGGGGVGVGVGVGVGAGAGAGAGVGEGDGVGVGLGFFFFFFFILVVMHFACCSLLLEEELPLDDELSEELLLESEFACPRLLRFLLNSGSLPRRKGVISFIGSY